MSDFEDVTSDTGGGIVEIKTSLISRNITVMGRRTSIRLEPEMWLALKEIAVRERCSIHDICTLVGVRKNPHSSLTAAIRVFLMLYFRAATSEEGHRKAGHGNFEHMMQRARIPEQIMSRLMRRGSENEESRTKLTPKSNGHYEGAF